MSWYAWVSSGWVERVLKSYGAGRGGAGRGGADHPVPIVTARAGPTREKPWILFGCGQVVCVDGPALQASGKSKSVSVFWCRQD